MTDVLLVAVGHGLAGRVSAIPGHRVVAIDRDNMTSVLLGQETGPAFRPELILIGPGLSPDRAITYATAVLEDYPTMDVYLATYPDPDLTRRVTDAGLAGVVDESMTDSALKALLEEAGRHSAAAPPVPPSTKDVAHQVVVVASPKGGVGKSTTAVNLAAVLAESDPGNVVVIDLDLQFGDISAMLDMSPAYTISQAFASGDDSMALRTLLMPHPAHFYVLCGSDDPAQNGRVSGDQIRKMVGQYSSIFRYVLIDTPAGLLEETLASLEEATDIVVVTALDVATLRSCRRELDVLRELSLLPQRRHIVLNRVDQRSGLGVRDAERILGMPVDVSIPLSDRVTLAANRGELVVAKRRRNPVWRPFHDLAHRVSDLSGSKGKGSDEPQ